MNANEPRLYGRSTMSDEECAAVLADIILEAISAEQAQEAETER